MRWAVVNKSTGVVENVIEWDPVTAFDYAPGDDVELRFSEQASPGDRWDGAKFTRPVPSTAPV